jgi:hypothetical protein
LGSLNACAHENASSQATPDGEFESHTHSSDYSS